MFLCNIHLRLIAVFCLTAFAGTSARSSSDFVFGECQPGKDKCRDCYISLAQALFQSDENVFNLSDAFFPPDTNTPEFVAVRYHLRSDSGKDTIIVWFWAASASYFLYPLATFQFLSLFFGKPEAYWTATVDVTLNATECEGMKQQHLTMLTQRLRIYVEQYDIRPSIDDTYQAEAINSAQLDELFDEKANQLTTIVICIQTLVVVMILSSTIVIALCVLKFDKKNDHDENKDHNLTCIKKMCCLNKIKYKPTIAKQSLLISFSFNGMLFLLYTVALDSAAIYYRNKSLLSDLKLIHHSDASGRPLDILYNIPIVVLVFDLIAAAVSVTMLLVVFIHFCYKGKDSNELISLMSSHLGPLIGLVTHSPFIAIAYINDAYYAGSIFVYYMVVFFVCFSAVHVTMNACLRVLLGKGKHPVWNRLFSYKSKTAENGDGTPLTQGKNGDGTPLTQGENGDGTPLTQGENGDIDDTPLTQGENGDNTPLTQGENGDNTPLVQGENGDNTPLVQGENGNSNANSRKTVISCRLLCPVVVIFLMLILILFTVAAVICYFVIIPLNGSVSGAPHQLVGFYQSIIIFLGVFITYKTILHKKYGGIKGAIKNIDTSPVSGIDDGSWNSLPNEEKSLEFYKMVVDIVKHYHKRSAPINGKSEVSTTSTPNERSGQECETKV